MDKAAKDALLSYAETDVESSECRKHLCRSLAVALRDAGQLLWVGGNLLGRDRVKGSSPCGFGCDAAVGLATVIQIAGELTAGAVDLLDRDNVYAAAALIRQLVEVEYLLWAFADESDEAAAWLRSTREDRRKFWQPRDLRTRSGERFRSSDYAIHCDRGGHPTPEAIALLPDHTRRVSPMLWWLDLAIHGTSAWEYAVSAERFGWTGELNELGARQDLPSSISAWRASEPLMQLVAR